MAAESVPPDGSIVPWTPHAAADQLDTMLDLLTESPGAVSSAKVADIARTMLGHMACPHSDCPLTLLEHKPLQRDEEGP